MVMETRSGASKGVRLLAAVSLLLTMVGCAFTVHKPLSTTPTTEPLSVSSTIPRDEISMRVKESNAGAGFGLLGALITASVNKSRSKNAEQRLAPLLEATADLNFRDMFWKAMEPELAASSWLRVKQLDKRAAGFTREEAKQLKTPLLMLNTAYELSADAQILIVQTRADLYLTDVDSPDYFGYYTYYSTRIAGKDVTDEQAVAQWTANNASAYRDALAEGIQENIFMLKYDLLSTPATPSLETGAETRFKFVDPTMATKVTYDGRTIRESEKRLLMRQKGGNLFSLPKDLAL